MNVWLVNPYGPIPGESWREYRFAMFGRALAARGHHVTWWTAGFDHFTKRVRSREWKRIDVSDRFSVVLVPTPSYRRNIGIGRVAFESVFASRLLRRARRETQPDLIIAADPPQIAGGYVARRLKQRTGAPLVLDCLDLWPEVFAGAFPRALRGLAKPLLWPLYRLRASTYSRADGVTASCETYRERILQIAAKPSRTVYLGISIEDLEKDVEPKRLGGFQAIYAGTLGHNYDLDTILDVARDVPSLTLVIAGDGPLRAHVASRIEREKLTNARYIGSLPAAELLAWYRGSDVGLVPYASWSTVAMPVKLFDYLAAGLPIVTSLSGELPQLIRECDIGLEYRPGNAASLGDALRTLGQDRPRQRIMSANARRCARRFDRDEQYRTFAEFAEGVAERASDERARRGDSGAPP